MAVIVLTVVLPALTAFAGFSAALGVILAGVLSGFLSTLITIDNSLCAFKDPEDHTGASLLGTVNMLVGAIAGIFGAGAAIYTQITSSSISVAVAGLDSGTCTDQKYKERLEMLENI